MKGCPILKFRFSVTVSLWLILPCLYLRDCRRSSSSFVVNKLPPMTKRFFVTGGAGFIGSNLVDRLLRDGPRGHGVRQPLDRPARASSTRRESKPASAWSKATCSTSQARRPPMRRPRLRLPPRGQRRRPLRHRAPAHATSSRTRSPPTTCWRRCAPAASSGSPSPRPARSTARPTVFPTPEDCAVPDPDVALRRLEAGRRRPDPAYADGLRLPAATSSASSRSSASATRHGHVSTSTSSC